MSLINFNNHPYFNHSKANLSSSNRAINKTFSTRLPIAFTVFLTCALIRLRKVNFIKYRPIISSKVCQNCSYTGPQMNVEDSFAWKVYHLPLLSMIVQIVLWYVVQFPSISKRHNLVIVRSKTVVVVFTSPRRFLGSRVTTVEQVFVLSLQNNPCLPFMPLPLELMATVLLENSHLWKYHVSHL
jgi:hypothetical protein